MSHQNLEKTLAFILNPVSGKHDIVLWSKQLELELKAKNLSHKFFITEDRGHARSLAKTLSDQGWKYIFSVGGDGTNTETIQGIMKSESNPVYGHIPKGTGNDWATFHGLSDNLSLISSVLIQPKLKFIDVCEVTEGQTITHYSNILGCGFDTQVVRFINEKINRKRPWTYKLAIIQNIFKYNPKHFKLTIDDQEMSIPLYSGHFGVGNQSGGGQIILPHAMNRASQIAYTLVHPTSKLNLLKATKSLNNGQITKLPFVHTGFASVIKLEGQDQTAFEADGELLNSKSISIRLKPKAIRLLDTSIV